MNKLFSNAFSSIEVKPSKEKDSISTNTNSSNSLNSETKSKNVKTITLNMSQSKRIKQIFDVENLEVKETKPQKIVYNEHIYFNPLHDKGKNDMTKVIKNVIQTQTKNLEIKQEGTNVYNVNLNINNNYYGSNFNINLSSRSEMDDNNTIGLVKSVPVKGGLHQDSGTPRNSNSSQIIVKKKKSGGTLNNQLSIPCINCGSLVDIDDIENHSNSCLKVKEEVLESMNQEASIDSFNTKLKKLDECIAKNKKSDNKDAHYYFSLSEYINNASGNLLYLSKISLFFKN